MEYRAEVQPGDTVWSICNRIRSDRDDMSELVRKTIEQNHIEDPAHLQPGMVIRVQVISVADEEVAK